MNAQAQTEQQEIVKAAEPKGDLEKITDYLEQPAVMARFTQVLGERQGRSYVISVMGAVAASDALRKCTPRSIGLAALRALTLKVSVDPALKQAYLAPFSKKVGDNQWIQEATLIVGYKGMYDMASRSGKYLWINVGPVYEGEVPVEERMSGVWSYGTTPRTSDRIIGWLAAFKKLNGEVKSLYMKNEKCEAHAEAYNPAGFKSATSAWNAHGGRDRWKMHRKTTMRVFLSLWGELSTEELQVLQEIKEDTSANANEGAFDSLAETMDQRTAVLDTPSFTGNGNGLGQLGFAVANPDPVTPGTRAEWENWLARAAKVKVDVQHPNLDVVTDSDLRAHMAEISRFILDAEEQAATN